MPATWKTLKWKGNRQIDSCIEESLLTKLLQMGGNNMVNIKEKHKTWSCYKKIKAKPNKAMANQISQSFPCFSFWWYCSSSAKNTAHSWPIRISTRVIIWSILEGTFLCISKTSDKFWATLLAWVLCDWCSCVRKTCDVIRMSAKESNNWNMLDWERI